MPWEKVAIDLKSILLLAALGLICRPAHAETKSITITDGRVVGSAVEQLEKIYAVPITYEDPPYFYEREVAKKIKPLSFSYELPPSPTTPTLGVGDALAAEAEAQRRNGPTNMQLASEIRGALAVDPTLEVRKTLAANALADVIKNYNALWGAEMFKVIEGNDGFHVVSIRYINLTGEVEELHAVLDTPISFAPEPRTPAEAVMEVCRAAMTASRQDIIPGSIAGLPARMMGMKNTITVGTGATNEPARAVLDRLFKEMPVLAEKEGPCISRGNDTDHSACYWDVPAHLSWQVWCEAGHCLLHVHRVLPPGAR